MKFLLATTDGCYFPDLIKEKVSRPGVYQWARAFNTGKDTGVVKHVKDISDSEYQEYDIVHINICGVSASLVPQVKRKLQGTDIKLITNLDYAIEIFQDSFPRPKELWQAIIDSDFIFAQEPFQQNMLSFFIKYHLPEKTKKFQVPLVPHPCDTVGLKQFRLPNEDRLDMIAVMLHRYRDHILIPAMVSWGLKSLSWGVGLTMGNLPMGLFNEASAMMEWDRYIYKLGHCTLALDYYLGIHSHSRFVEECACLGIPTVSTKESYMGAQLFPEVNHDEMNLEGLRDDLEKLTEGFEQGEPSPFYLEIQEKGAERVEAFNWENSKKRLLDGMRSWEIKI